MKMPMADVPLATAGGPELDELADEVAGAEPGDTVVCARPGAAATSSASTVARAVRNISDTPWIAYVGCGAGVPLPPVVGRPGIPGTEEPGGSALLYGLVGTP